MAQLSLGEARWRMIRRVLRKPKFKYEDARNMTRNDQVHFDWLIKEGFFAGAGAGGWYKVTDKGKAAAELGFYEI